MAGGAPSGVTFQASTCYFCEELLTCTIGSDGLAGSTEMLKPGVLMAWPVPLKCLSRGRF
jgi:hypothetical protein